MAEERGGFAAGDPVPPRILSWHCAVYDHESSAQNTPVKGALGNQYPLTLCVLRTFHPARGGEAYGVLPGQSPRLRVVPIRTRGLVRRVIPFVGIAAVFAVAVGTGAPALLAFPLFLLAVLTVALFDDSGQLLAVGGAAGSGANLRLMGGCSSMAELQPSKLAMWVRSPSPAPNRVNSI